MRADRPLTESRITTRRIVKVSGARAAGIKLIALTFVSPCDEIEQLKVFDIKLKQVAP